MEGSQSGSSSLRQPEPARLRSKLKVRPVMHSMPPTDFGTSTLDWDSRIDCSQEFRYRPGNAAAAAQEAAAALRLAVMKGARAAARRVKRIANAA